MIVAVGLGFVNRFTNNVLDNLLFYHIIREYLLRTESILSRNLTFLIQSWTNMSSQYINTRP